MNMTVTIPVVHDNADDNRVNTVTLKNSGTYVVTIEIGDRSISIPRGHLNAAMDALSMVAN